MEKGTANRDTQGLELKKGLELNKDYRGVNKEVWTLL